MALPSVADLKLVLRIQGTAEDTLLTALLARAQAGVESELGRPVTAAESTWTDWGDSAAFDGVLRTLQIPVVPCEPTSLVIEDADGVTLDPAVAYYEPTSPWAATVRARPGMTFPVAPYTLTADVGLSADARYATVIEPVIAAAILDVAADLYQRRSAAASNESTGGGVSTSYANVGLPARVREMLSPWKAGRA